MLSLSGMDFCENPPRVDFFQTAFVTMLLGFLLDSRGFTMTVSRWLCVAVFFLAGCSTTYVNIPEHPEDVASHDPNVKSVQEVSVVAVRAVLADQSIDGSYQLMLPQGTSAATYTLVAPQLGEQVRWSAEGAALGLPVIDVHQLRIRGWVAQADVVRQVDPRQSGSVKQLVTVDLEWSPGLGWHATRLHVWRVNVDEAIWKARYSQPQGQPLQIVTQPQKPAGDSAKEVATPAK